MGNCNSVNIQKPHAIKVHVLQPDLNDNDPTRKITITRPDGAVQVIFQKTTDPASLVPVGPHIDEERAQRINNTIKKFMEDQQQKKDEKFNEEMGKINKVIHHDGADAKVTGENVDEVKYADLDKKALASYGNVSISKSFDSVPELAEEALKKDTNGFENELNDENALLEANEKEFDKVDNILAQLKHGDDEKLQSDEWD